MCNSNPEPKSPFLSLPVKSIFCNLSVWRSETVKGPLPRPPSASVCEFDKKGNRERNPSSLNLGAKTIIRAGICELKELSYYEVHYVNVLVS